MKNLLLLLSALFILILVSCSKDSGQLLTQDEIIPTEIQAKESNPLDRSKNTIGVYVAAEATLYLHPDSKQEVLDYIGARKESKGIYSMVDENSKELSFDIKPISTKEELFKKSLSLKEIANNDNKNPMDRPAEGIDFVVHANADCVQVWAASGPVCKNIEGGGSVSVELKAYKTCQGGATLCIETLKTVKIVKTYTHNNCEGAPKKDITKMLSCS